MSKWDSVNSDRTCIAISLSGKQQQLRDPSAYRAADESLARADDVSTCVAIVNAFMASIASSVGLPTLLMAAASADSTSAQAATL